jgi:hypothetical protein
VIRIVILNCSVTERSREIGIRLAIDAQERGVRFFSGAPVGAAGSHRSDALRMAMDLIHLLRFCLSYGR